MTKGYNLGLKWDFTGVAVQLGEKKNSNSHTFCILCDQLTCVVTPIVTARYSTEFSNL